MTREEIVKLIESSQLEEATKKGLLTLIIEKGLTNEVVDQIKESFDDAVISTMKEAGVDLTQTEEFKAAENEFAASAEEAVAELDSKMSEVDSQMKTVQVETGQQLDNLQAKIIKDKIS